MDAIAIRCKKCQHGMKFAPEKAGKKAKCPKCEAINLIQAEEESIEPAPAPPPEAPAAPPPPAPAADPFDDDGPANYGVFLDPELEERRKKLQEEEEAAGKKKKDRKALPKVTRKVKAIPDAAAWSMVRFGMIFVFAGTWIWLACHLMQGSYVLLGSAEFPEYAAMMGRNLELRNDEGVPERGRGWDLDELEIHLGMIGGRDFAGYARLCLVVASVLYFFQAILWGLGYGCCFPVPRRFGMFGLILVLLGLAVLNILFSFIFKLLAVTSVHGYVLIPYVVPEIVMTEYNMERLVPIHILWSGAPFWENVLNLILKFLFYLEPTILSIFIWYAGVAIKDETIEQGGMGRVQMSLGTFFILVCFHLLSLCGASPVLVQVLRVLYALWFFFLIIFMLQFAMLLLKFRAVLDEKINPKNELQDEPKKKKKK